MGRFTLAGFHWFSVSDELSRIDPVNKLPKSLEIGKTGFLDALRWVQQPTRDLVDDQIEIEVHAVGMNFKVCFCPTIQ